MLDNVTRFDMKMAPKRQKLRFIGYLKALPVLWSHHGKISKVNMKGIKPPYLLLANHNALMDVDILNLANSRTASIMSSLSMVLSVEKNY